MSSEVETPRGATHRNATGFLDCARNDKAQQATRPVFADLTVYHDASPHSAAMNMSIDEALLESASIATIRFYRWRSPALSFGYFGKFSDTVIYATGRDVVRRWTGGGIVLHGADLTYSIVIPASDPMFDETSIAIYEKVHRALCEALKKIGAQAVLTEGIDPGTLRMRAAVSNSDHNCFANPVRADVVMDGRKIAGAAQRRTRRGLLQQGSIQGFPMNSELAQNFSQALSTNCREFEINEEIFQRAQALAQQKYGTDFWLRKR